MRFTLGDLARIVVAPVTPENLGKIVQIIAIGPYVIGQIVVGPSGTTYRMDKDYDYVVDVTGRRDDGTYLNVGESFIQDWKLQPIDPPSEPKALQRSEEIENV